MHEAVFSHGKFSMTKLFNAGDLHIVMPVSVLSFLIDAKKIKAMAQSIVLLRIHDFQIIHVQLSI